MKNDHLMVRSTCCLNQLSLSSLSLPQLVIQNDPSPLSPLHQFTNGHFSLLILPRRSLSFFTPNDDYDWNDGDEFVRAVIISSSQYTAQSDERKEGRDTGRRKCWGSHVVTPVSSKDCSSCNINGNEAQLLCLSLLSLASLSPFFSLLSNFLPSPHFTLIPFQCVQTLNHVFITGRRMATLNAIVSATIVAFVVVVASTALSMNKKARIVKGSDTEKNCGRRRGE